MLALCHSLGMHEQNQIASTLASADGINRLQDLLAQAGSASRTDGINRWVKPATEMGGGSARRSDSRTPAAGPSWPAA